MKKLLLVVTLILSASNAFAGAGQYTCTFDQHVGLGRSNGQVSKIDFTSEKLILKIKDITDKTAKLIGNAGESDVSVFNNNTIQLILMEVTPSSTISIFRLDKTTNEIIHTKSGYPTAGTQYGMIFLGKCK